MSQISITGILIGAAFDFIALYTMGFIIAFVAVMTTGVGTGAEIEALSSPDIDLVMAVVNYAALVVVVPPAATSRQTSRARDRWLMGAFPASFVCWFMSMQLAPIRNNC
jgi:hypothetical protein